MTDEKEKPSFVGSLAGDTKKGSDDGAALPDRLSRYSMAHHRALDMADYIRTAFAGKKKINGLKDSTFDLLAAQLEKCGSYLLFRDYFQAGKIRLHSMISCRKHMLCPLCAVRRGAKSVKAYLDRLEIIQQEKPGLKAYLVTFTVKNGEDLLERYNHIQGSIRVYHQQRVQASYGKRSPVEANKAAGSVWSYEFKRGKGSGLWHPHVHAIWLCEEVPDQVEIRKEWKAITGDSHIVDVTPFHDQNDVTGGFLEVFKYALKFSDMPLDQNWEGYSVLSGRRLVGSFGCFRGVQVPESMTDECLDDEPYVELFYRFVKGCGYNFVKASEVVNPLQD